MTQSEADSEIKKAIKLYLSNNSNSVSGDNFKLLVFTLNKIQCEWLHDNQFIKGHCAELKIF